MQSSWYCTMMSSILSNEDRNVFAGTVVKHSWVFIFLFGVFVPPCGQWSVSSSTNKQTTRMGNQPSERVDSNGQHLPLSLEGSWSTLPQKFHWLTQLIRVMLFDSSNRKLIKRLREYNRYAFSVKVRIDSVISTGWAVYFEQNWSACCDNNFRGFLNGNVLWLREKWTLKKVIWWRWWT